MAYMNTARQGKHSSRDDTQKSFARGLVESEDSLGHC